jgi:hypothetical protein
VRETFFYERSIIASTRAEKRLFSIRPDDQNARRMQRFSFGSESVMVDV